MDKVWGIYTGADVLKAIFKTEEGANIALAEYLIYDHCCFVDYVELRD